MCDALMAGMGFGCRIATGRSVGRASPKPGTPDTAYFKNGKWVFVECSTQKGGIERKICADIEKDMSEDRSGVTVSDIEAVYYFWSRGDLQPAEFSAAAEKLGRAGIGLEFFGNSRIANEIYLRQGHIALDYLGVQVCAREISDLDTFVGYYSSPANGLPLDNAFCLRYLEFAEVLASIQEKRLTVISGPPGVGKTKLAVSVLGSLRGQREIVCVRGSRNVTAADLKRALLPCRDAIVLLDDANLIPDLPELVRVLVGDSSRTAILTARDYVLQDIRRSVLGAAFHFAAGEEVNVINLARFSDEGIEHLARDSFGVDDGYALRRIAALARGNARVAAMACEVFKRSGGLKGVADASLIFERFYEDVMRACLDDAVLHKAAALVAAIHPLVASASWLSSGGVLAGFGMDAANLHAALRRLERRGVVSFEQGEVAAFNDQNLRSYVAKRAFVDGDVLQLGDLIELVYPLIRDDPVNRRSVEELVCDLLEVFGDGAVRDEVAHAVRRACRHLEDGGCPGVRRLRLALCDVDPESALAYVSEIVGGAESTCETYMSNGSHSSWIALKEALLAGFGQLYRDGEMGVYQYLEAVKGVAAVFTGIGPGLPAYMHELIYRMLEGYLRVRQIEPLLLSRALAFGALEAVPAAFAYRMRDDSRNPLNFIGKLSASPYREEALRLLAEFCGKNPAAVNDACFIVASFYCFAPVEGGIRAVGALEIARWLEGLEGTEAGDSLIPPVLECLLGATVPPILTSTSGSLSSRAYPTDDRSAAGRRALWELALDVGLQEAWLRGFVRSYVKRSSLGHADFCDVEAIDLPYLERYAELSLDPDDVNDACMLMMLEQNLNVHVGVKRGSPLALWRNSRHAQGLALFGVVDDPHSPRDFERLLIDFALAATVESVDEVFDVASAVEGLAGDSERLHGDRPPLILSILRTRYDNPALFERGCERLFAGPFDVRGIGPLMLLMVEMVGSDEVYRIVSKAPQRIRARRLFEYFTCLPASKIGRVDYLRLQRFIKEAPRWDWETELVFGIRTKFQLSAAWIQRFDVKRFRNFEVVFPGAIRLVVSRAIEMAPEAPFASEMLLADLVNCADKGEAMGVASCFLGDEGLLERAIAMSLENRGLQDDPSKCTLFTWAVGEGILNLASLLQHSVLASEGGVSAVGFRMAVSNAWRLGNAEAIMGDVLDWAVGLERVQRFRYCWLFKPSEPELLARSMKFARGIIRQSSRDVAKIAALLELYSSADPGDWVELMGVFVGENDDVSALFKMPLLVGLPDIPIERGLKARRSDELLEKLEAKFRSMGAYEHCRYIIRLRDDLEKLVDEERISAFIGKYTGPRSGDTRLDDDWLE